MSGVDWKDQRDAREYAERVGVEYRFSCLEEKDPQACHLLADYFEAVEKKPERAYETYKENCEERNHLFSCFKYGVYHASPNLKGPKVKSMDKAVECFEKACNGRIGRSCRYLGQAWMRGTETRKPDAAKCETALDMGCSQDDPACCWWLSALYMGPYTGQQSADKSLEDNLNNSQISQSASNPRRKPKSEGQLKTEKFLVPDKQKAFEYAIKGCDMNHHESCANVFRMYELGFGVEKNKEKAAQFKEKTKDIIDSVLTGEPLNYTG